MNCKEGHSWCYFKGRRECLRCGIIGHWVPLGLFVPKTFGDKE